MTNDPEQFYMYLLFISISSFENYLLVSFVHFLTALFVLLLLSSLSSFQIPSIDLGSVAYFLTVFPVSVYRLFTPLNVSLAVHRAYSAVLIQFVCFYFI